MSIGIGLIEAALARVPPPDPGAPPARKRAAVAVVLRERAGEVEVLLIRRSERDDDPWSGHVAFPGGRADPGDPSIEATAAREAREEVGIALDPPAARILGRLPDHSSFRRMTGLAISPILFEVRGDPPLSLDAREVAATAWVPLAALRSGAHDGRMIYWTRPLRRLPLKIPLFVTCWRYRDFTIWGVTHRILLSLFAALEPAAGAPLPCR